MRAYATETSWDAVSVFAQNFGQKVGSATTFEEVEVFAPQLRHPVNAPSRVSKGSVVVVRSGRQTIQHPSTAFGTDFDIAKLWQCESTLDFPSERKYGQSMSSEASLRLPTWLRPVLDSMTKRWGIGQGWDTYDAKPTNYQYADQLLEYLLTIMREDYTPPIITPLSDGGLQAEWHGNNRDFEIVVSAEEPAKYYYFNAETEEEEEEELDKQDLTYVRKFIANF